MIRLDTVWTSLSQIEFQVKFYDVKGIKTRCLEAGEGEPVIFLHGTGGHLEAYSRNIVAHVQNHFRVYAIDMIGHGFTDKVYDRDLTIPVYTDHLLNFMDVVGLGRASISGESLGGWVAAWFAWEHPDRVNKIVLNTAGGLTMYPEVMQRIKTLTMEAVRDPSVENVRKRLEFLMYDPQNVTDELIEIRRAIYQLPNMVQNTERILCLQEKDIRQKYLFTDEQLRSIQAPTCVIWTTHDPTAPVDIGRRFADLIRVSEFHVLDNCGHWPQFEAADEFNRIQIDFLKRQFA